MLDIDTPLLVPPVHVFVLGFVALEWSNEEPSPRLSVAAPLCVFPAAT